MLIVATVDRECGTTWFQTKVEFNSIYQFGSAVALRLKRALFIYALQILNVVLTRSHVVCSTNQ